MADPTAGTPGQPPFNFKQAISQMVQRHGSDLLLKVGRSPTIRVNGDLTPLGMQPLKPEDLKAGRAIYNHVPCDPGIEDLPGDNVFHRDEAGNIFHTYSCFARGGEDFMTIYRLLDATPKGRNEHGPHVSLADWARPNNMYCKGGEVAPNGRFTQPVSCCM